MASRRLVRSLADSGDPPGAPLQEANGLLYLVTQIRTTVKSTVGWRPGDVREWFSGSRSRGAAASRTRFAGVLEIRRREIRSAHGARARRQVRGPRLKEGFQEDLRILIR